MFASLNPRHPQAEPTTSTKVFRQLLLLGAIGLLCLSTQGALLAQIVVEDLDIEEQLVSDEIEQVFESALELSQSIDQADSLPLFTRVINELQPMVITGDERVMELLSTSLLQRAEANFNLGENEAARADLVTLVTTAPGFEIDDTFVSQRLARMYEDVRDDLVGYVEFIVDPPDAKVTINGSNIRTDAGPVPILTATYTANVERPGYTSASSTFEVKSGKTELIEAILERTSAVLSLRTRPADARILIDGVERARTEGVAGDDFIASGAAAAYDRSEFSDRAYVDNLQPGSHQIEIRKAGFRPYEASVEISDMVDLDLGAIPLEQEAGTLVLTSLPSGAEVLLDGEVVRPFAGASGNTGELPLSPGTYVLSVNQGVFGRFETTIDIRDQQATNVAVKLQPALVLLGVLGKDEVGARKLSSGLTDAFQKGDQWALLDRSASAGPVLSEAGVTAEALRRIVNGAERSTVDWPEVQRSVDEKLPGSVYILSVLSDDLLATDASLWIWPAGPGPAQPELRRVRLDDLQALDELAAGFTPKLDPVRPTFGATLVDTPLAPGPVIVAITPGKAAAAAGLVVGDAVTSVNGTPVYSEALFFQEFLKLEAGQQTKLEVQRAGEVREATLTTGSSYSVIDLSDPSRVAAPLAAALAGELQSASDWPRWVLQLNQSAVLLHAGDTEGAVRQLRQIDLAQAPGQDAHGLSVGTVNYWLGVALEQAGPRYLDRARDAYQNALAAEGARLFHDDGPRVAPRAWARLQRLAPSSP